MSKTINEVIKDIEELRKYEANHKLADNFKMITVGILVLSMVLFSVMGDDNVKPIIWNWATFMVAILIIDIVLDIIANKKDRADGLK